MPQHESLIQMLYLPVCFIGIFYFFIIRPQQQQQKKAKELIDNLKKNDEVITSSGIHGTVVIVKDKTVVLRVDEGTRIEFLKDHIHHVTNTEVKPEVVK